MMNWKEYVIRIGLKHIIQQQLIRVLPRVFAHYTSARRRYAPHDLEMTSDSKIKRVIEIVFKKSHDEFILEFKKTTLCTILWYKWIVPEIIQKAKLGLRYQVKGIIFITRQNSVWLNNGTNHKKCSMLCKTARQKLWRLNNMKKIVKHFYD